MVHSIRIELVDVGIVVWGLIRVEMIDLRE
jgi:hypothetical protein